ncbi:MAG: 5'/3'-nucleotidase SurE [Rhodospirillales bacterium]|nr:5'/3'-nucleotidase SurE [Rhodospirillales bacterium]
MASNVLDLSKARVLVSNDDGINAPGLKVLEKIAREIAAEVWVVAPETEQSAASHSLTRMRPLRIRQVSERRFAVDGSPTDCALLGIRKILADNPPDIVLSGINPGGNLCDDVTYSGTIAVAMEGALLGIPGLALSLAHEGSRPLRWGTVEHWAPGVLRHLTETGWPKNVVLNLNFPNVPSDAVKGVEVTAQGAGKTGQGITEAVDPHGNDIFWLGTEDHEDRIRNGDDVDAINRGAVSITPLCLDLTHRPSIKALKAAFS